MRSTQAELAVMRQPSAEDVDKKRRSAQAPRGNPETNGKIRSPSGSAGILCHVLSRHLAIWVEKAYGSEVLGRRLCWQRFCFSRHGAKSASCVH